jgi:hypothetical protein
MIGFEFELPDFYYGLNVPNCVGNACHKPNKEKDQYCCLGPIAGLCSVHAFHIGDGASEDSNKRYLATQIGNEHLLFYEDTEKVPFMRITEKDQKDAKWKIEFTADTNLKLEIVMGPYYTSEASRIKGHCDMLYEVVKWLYVKIPNDQKGVTLENISQALGGAGFFAKYTCQIGFDCGTNSAVKTSPPGFDAEHGCATSVEATSYHPTSFEHLTIVKNNSSMLSFGPQVTVTWPLNRIDELLDLYQEYIKKNLNTNSGSKNTLYREEQNKVSKELSKRVDGLIATKIEEGIIIIEDNSKEEKRNEECGCFCNLFSFLCKRKDPVTFALDEKEKIHKKIEGLLRLFVLYFVSAIKFSHPGKSYKGSTSPLKDFTALLWKSEFYTLKEKCFTEKEQKALEKIFDAANVKKIGDSLPEIAKELLNIEKVEPNLLGTKEVKERYPIHDKVPTWRQMLEAILQGSNGGAHDTNAEKHCRQKGFRETPTQANNEKPFPVFKYSLNTHLDADELEYWSPIEPTSIIQGEDSKNGDRLNWGPVLELRRAGPSSDKNYTMIDSLNNPFWDYAKEFVHWLTKST